MKRSILAVGLVAALVAPAAAQQHLSWTNYCVGFNPLCFNLDLSLTPITTGGTLFAIRAQNLEGTMGTTPWAMDYFDFSMQYTGPIIGMAVGQAQFTGTAGVVVTGTPEQCAGWAGGCPTYPVPIDWDVYNPTGGAVTGTGDMADLHEEFNWEGRPPTWARGVIGCDAPKTDELEYFQTCGDGAVTYNLPLPGTWRFTQQSVVSGSGGMVLRMADATNVTATPEPSTFILFGSGLLAVFMWRRRRTLQ